MNREKNLCLRKEFFVSSPGPHLDGGEATGPIVAMQNVRRLTEPSKQSNRRATQKSEPFEIVPFTINLAAVEVLPGFNQISRRLQRLALPNVDARTLTAPFNFEIVDENTAE